MRRFSLYYLFIFALLASCSSIKESVGSKKNNSDEFLVEKKSPLLMPPDYNDLPVPNSEDVKNEGENNQVKKLITKSNNTDSNFNKSNNSKSSFEELLIEKIKN
jgi:hypothetical protein|tara:strand:- start:363 stop:674 length:312 start_codon:yes stop_codon:yes gene_type:complete